MKSYSIKAGFVLFSLSAVLAACSGEQPTHTEQLSPVKVTVARPEKKAMNSIMVSGQLESSATATISTRMMGFIMRIMVKPGDKVSKGQLLVSINSNDVQAKRAQAHAMVAEAEAVLNDAKKDFERYTQLFEQQSASAKELENVRLHFESMKSKTEAAHQMEREADAMLLYANITAPFSGVVTQKFASEGSMASPGMPLLVVEQVGTWQANTSVTETEITNVIVGTDAEVVIKSLGRLMKGKVSEVSTSPSASGQYTVKIILPMSGDMDLHAGMHVTASIGVSCDQVSEPTILVPAKALVYKDQLIGLYTVSENKTALLRWIKTGRSVNDEVEVLSGINENESFISSSDGKLYNGMPVVIQ